MRRAVTGRRVLVCSYHVPQPDRDSGARRIFHFLEFLQEAGWTVSFLASDGAGDPRDVRALERRSIAVYDAYRDDVRALFANGRFDLALIAFWLNADRYLALIREVSPATRVIVDSVDLHLLREARQILHRRRDDAAAGGLDAAYATRLAGELNTYAAADGVLTVSQKEADLIADFAAHPGLAHPVPDSEEMTPSSAPFDRRMGILSLGSFQHTPNVQAVEFLCREIVPRIDARLLRAHPHYVVGNGLTDAIRSLADGLPYVRMVGWVPSVEPYFEQVRISVVPLRYGAGTKRKMIQTLMTGTPVVTTSVGIEGLNLRDGLHVLVADDAETFAAAVTRLLTNERLWRKLAREGRAHVLRAHSPETARLALLSAVEHVLERPLASRMPASGAAPDRAADDAGAETPSGEPTSLHPHLHYQQQLVPDVLSAVAESVPSDATVAVVSKGDHALLELGGRRGRHFPDDPSGVYLGHHPADSADAIERLEAARRDGVEFLVFPGTAFWWLDHYAEFARHLRDHYRELLRRDGTCVIYELRSRPDPVETTPLVRLADDRVETTDAAAGVKLIALYLPQFHPIPENDRWWGAGFTEWRNVAKADPLFSGHYQPHVPADLGFYDLRVTETREAQAGLAREYGIHGFCYYHYWFHGTQLLERPVNDMLSSGRPDFPFCLCWANDPWSRRWDGRDDDLLQAQTYSPADDVAHIRSLLPALADPRAITIDGRPVFLVYRGRHMPDAARTTDVWRREVQKAGLKGIHLVAMETAWDLGWDATAAGFDATLLFQPQFGKLITSVPKLPIAGKPDLQVYDYEEAWRVLGHLEAVSHRRYETVCPGWDNTARVGERAVVLHNASPDAYERMLRRAILTAGGGAPEHRVVFINAWNEWAEGCHLEPDVRHGRAYLEATRRALEAASAVGATHGHTDAARQLVTG
jgi:glycosyltransferase involved in cell wall biosynthesis